MATTGSGLKGSLNEYELDLLRQRSLSARYEKARRGELVVSAPVGFVKACQPWPASDQSDWAIARCSARLTFFVVRKRNK